MGAIPCWSHPYDLSLFKSGSDISQTSRLTTSSQGVSGDLCTVLKKGDSHLSLVPVPAAGQECFKNSTEIHGNSLALIDNVVDQRCMPFLRNRRLSSACEALPLLRRGIRRGVSGCHSGVGCCSARLELRFTSLSDWTDIKNWQSIQSQGQRRPFNLSRRWYIYKSRVICTARREEDGGRQERSYSQPEANVVDHYKVLGLRRQATASAIKLAYRQLARQLHPDVNKDVDANEKFMSVRLAYEVLSDETSRTLYDSSLQEQLQASRRKQVYQRRERDTWLRERQNKSHYRRAPHENAEWSYSVYSYENEYSNMESYYYTYPSSGMFSNKKKSSRNSNRDRSPEEDMKQRDWQVDLQSIGREALLFLWVVSAMWHALGAQTALALLVGTLALWKEFAVGYRLASGVAWLMGGEKGLALMVALIVTTRVFGRAYHAVAAIVALALWLGGGVLKAVPLPHGAILVLVYKCIQLQSSV